MLEKILISIISVIVLIQLYCNFNYKNSVIPSEKDIEEDIEEDKKEENDNKQVDKKQTDNILKNNNIKNKVVLNNNSTNDNYINTNKNLNIFDDYAFGGYTKNMTIYDFSFKDIDGNLVNLIHGQLLNINQDQITHIITVLS